MRDAQPDLEMRVSIETDGGRTRLRFTLNSPLQEVGLFHLKAFSPSFQLPPEDYHRHLRRRIEQLAERQDVDGGRLAPAVVRHKLESLGQELWRDLFSPELRSAYRRIREHVHSWMIVSDEPWIPWELVKPYEDGASGKEAIDDDFLAIRFELTRWLAGTHTPVREIAIPSLAALLTAEDLPGTTAEKELLEDLARDHSLGVDAPSLGSVGDLLGYLRESEARLFHFMGHGHAAARADESGIPLPDRSFLRPQDLEGAVASHLREARPMVFLNACWAGQLGWSLVRLGGWARYWVANCGCSAFVGPMWPIPDKSALRFAETFYRALAHGAPLGEAARIARERAHEERPDDPSVLAIAVYGHPHAQVVFGQAPSTEGARDAKARETVKIPWPSPRPSPRRRWRSWWGWAAAALFVAGIAHFTAPSVVERFFPMDTSPVPESLREKLPKPPVKTTRKQEATSTGKAGAETTVGGLRFVVSGGSAQINPSLKAALSSATGSLPPGWTVRLSLDPPAISTYEDFGTSMVSCRLAGEASAKGPGGSIDLGPLSKVSSQPTEYNACNAAAKLLARDVVSELNQQLGTKGEP